VGANAGTFYLTLTANKANSGRQMIHIKHILANVVENASKAKLYHQNRDIFLKYFDSVEQYEALISAGNFKKIDEIIKQNSSFNLDEFIINFKN
jgi:hypothetical protein